MYSLILEWNFDINSLSFVEYKAPTVLKFISFANFCLINSMSILSFFLAKSFIVFVLIQSTTISSLTSKGLYLTTLMLFSWITNPNFTALEITLSNALLVLLLIFVIAKLNIILSTPNWLQKLYGWFTAIYVLYLFLIPISHIILCLLVVIQKSSTFSSLNIPRCSANLKQKYIKELTKLSLNIPS